MLGAMRFGLALPQYGFSLPTGRIGLDDAVAWGGRAEDLGFDSVWLSDHFFYSFARYGADPSPVAALEPLTALAAIATGTTQIRLGVRYATGWNVVWRVSPEDHAGRVADVAAACGREGRDPATFRRTVGLYGTIGLTEDDARARFERARASFPGQAMRDETWETWRADTLSGSPQQVVDRVRAFEALGVEELILSPWALPFAVLEPEIVEVFAEHVMPTCR